MQFSRSRSVTLAHVVAAVLAMLIAVVGASSSGAAPAQSSAAPAGLVAAYSFDDGVGQSLADVSGRGNTGTISGATWTAGRSGSALRFDGINDFVSVKDAPSLDLSTGMTLEAWVQPTTQDSIWRTVVTKEKSGNLTYGLFSNSDTSVPAGIVTIGSRYAQSITRGPGAVTPNTWTHLATTYDGAALKLYVNGVQIASQAVTGSMANTNRALKIGGNAIWPEWFSGSIDDLRIYNRALNVSEVQADMNTPVGGATPTDTQAPSAPGSLAASAQTQTSITLSWTASTDDTGVAGYRSFRNGTQVGTGTATSYAFAGLACGTTYTLAVEAYDAAGNTSSRPSISTATSSCTTPPPSGSANLWVDVNGGTCTRQSTPGAYADAQACSWSGAYQAAQTGDLILVKGGSYGNVTIGPNRTPITAPGITFRTAAGESVTINDFENGHIAGSAGANNVTLVGPVTARTFRSDRSSNVVVDGWNVDCNGCINVQVFHLESSSDVVVRNSEIQDNTDNSLIWINGTNLTFENNRIHDAGLRSGSGAHTECMYVWSVTNLTLKRNHFYHCSVMDVFITGSSVANGGYVENNVFEKPWSTTGQISNSALAFHFRNGGDPSPDPSNWDFRYNTFVGPLSISSENPVGSGGMRLLGNVFLSGAPCGLANTTYSYNAFVSGGCGSNAITNSLSTYQAGFTSTGDPGDYGLRSTSVLVDKGSVSSYPTVDRAGTARFGGSAPDLGAFEHAG